MFVCPLHRLDSTMGINAYSPQKGLCLKISIYVLNNTPVSATLLIIDKTTPPPFDVAFI